MAVAPQPHPNSVFRYLKTAYRNWMKTGAITLGAISNTTTATAVSASGTILPNVGVSNVALTLNQGTVVASTIMAPVIHPSGTFTGSSYTAPVAESVTKARPPGAMATSLSCFAPGTS